MEPAAIRALLMEDNRGDARLIQEMVRESTGPKMHLEVAESLSDGLKRLEVGDIDVALVDLGLPDSQGIDTFLRVHSKSPHVPTVVLTGLADDALALEAINHGAQDYLVKGFINGTLLLRSLQYAIERRRAEEAVLRVERRFRAMIEKSAEVITIVAPDGTFLYQTDSVRKVLGYESGELMGKNAFDLLHYEDRTRIVSLFNHMLRHPGSSVESEARMRHKDGSWRWLEGTATDLLLDPNVQGIVINYRDITARRKNELRIRKLSLAVEQSAESIFITDKDGRIEFVNPAMERLSGYSADELIGKNPRVVKSGKLEKSFYENMWRTIKSGNAFRGTFINRRKNGEIYYEQQTITPLMDEKGSITHFVSSGHDVTNNHQAQAALERSESELRALFEAMEDVIFILDHKGTYLKVAPTKPDNLYAPREDLLGKTVDEVLPQADANVVKAKIRECLESGKQVTYEYRLVTESRTVWFEARVSPLDGSSVFFIGHDITARKEARARIEEQARLLELASDAIIVRDLEDRVVFWNKGAENLYGWKREEVLGRKVPEFVYATTEVHETAREAALATGTWFGELTHITRAQGTVVVSSRWTVVRDEAGNPKSVLVINTDITSQKLMEQQLLRSQRLESIGTLAGGIAHDLNNALGPILLGVQVIERKVTDETALKVLKNIEASAQRGADMVKQILAFARGLSGDFGVLHPKHVLDEIHKIISETFPKNITIAFAIPKELHTISGDATQIHQLIMNLCVNARDAMPQGGKLLLTGENLDVDEYYATMHPGLKPGPHILLKVVDTGTGIPKNILDKIFDPFFTTKKTGKGTGLGLSTVSTIAKTHGGTVDVSSEVNRGTTFTVYLPAVPSAQPEQPRPLETVSTRGNGELILVVDDEVTLREMIKQTLEMFGYRVVLASEGTEAVSQFVSHQSDVQLVVTDMAMPVMDGEATIRALRKLSPELRIIATSGQHDTISKEVVKRLGITRSLLKPFTASHLLRAVSDVLTRPGA